MNEQQLATKANYNKPNGLGVMRIFRAFLCSVAGYATAWKHESAFRQEVTIALFLLPFGWFISSTLMELLFLGLTLLLVILAELFNSALEALADRITLQQDPMIKASKDISSAAVFSSLVFVVISWSMMALAKFQILSFS